jgi:hypothetical protein
VRHVTLGLLLLGVAAVAGCGGDHPAARPQSAREYAEQREREINATGPSWAQRLAAAPGADDVERAIALVRTNDDYDYQAVDFLAHELSVARDSRIETALIEVVANASFPSRDRAATALAKAGVTEARTAMLARMQEPTATQPLIAALGQIGDASTVHELSYLAWHTDDLRIRQNANMVKHLIAVRLARQSE